MTVTCWDSNSHQRFFGPACWQTRLWALLAYTLLRSTLWVMTLIGTVINRLRPSLLQHLQLDRIDDLFKVIPPKAHTHIRRVSLDHCQGEWIVAPNARHSSQVIIYFHGSALVTLGLHSYRRFCSILSEQTGAQIFNVGYRLAPRAHLQDSLADAFQAYQQVLEWGYRPDQIVLAGDSAGALLVPLTAVRARDQHMGVPAGLVLLSPLCSADMMLKYQASRLRRDVCFPYRTFAFLYRVYATANGTRSLPPMPDQIDLRGLGPCLIQVSNTEMLRNDAFAFAARLASSQVPVWIQTWDHAPHVFQLMWDLNPDARRAVDQIAEFCHSLR